MTVKSGFAVRQAILNNFNIHHVWDLGDSPALRTALVGCVIVTAVGGILSSPLFTWASQAVAGTPLLQAALG